MKVYVVFSYHKDEKGNWQPTLHGVFDHKVKLGYEHEYCHECEFNQEIISYDEDLEGSLIEIEGYEI